MPSSDFAAAHQRIVERRRQREAAALAQQDHDASTTATGLIARLPPSLRPLWSGLHAQWALALGREGTNPSFRVGQLDSELLDGELLDLFRAQVSDALKYYSPHLLDDFSAEISLFLRAILFKLTIWDHNASYGASLQNLHYIDARSRSLSPRPPSTWQKALLGVLSIGGPYIWTKWQDRLLNLTDSYDYSDSPQPRHITLLARLTEALGTTHALASFASFTLFLLNGRYRTLLDRLLHLRLTPRTSAVNREVSFEYLNRQLVWHAFTEFLLFLLPLVGINRWRRWLSRAWRRAQHVFQRDVDEDDGKKGGELGFLPERTCAICYQDQNPSVGSAGESEVAAGSVVGSGVVGSAQTDVTNPYQAVPCACVYCFVCLAGRLDAEEGEGWVCLRCGEVVSVCRPWNGDVLEMVEQDHSAAASADDHNVQEKGNDVTSSPHDANSARTSKSVSFATDVQDDHDHDTIYDRTVDIKTIDPMPIEDDDEHVAEYSTSSIGAYEDVHDDLHGPLGSGAMVTAADETGVEEADTDVHGNAAEAEAQGGGDAEAEVKVETGYEDEDEAAAAAAAALEQDQDQGEDLRHS